MSIICQFCMRKSNYLKPTKQITDYFEMEKLLTHDVEDKLTKLSKSLIELIQWKQHWIDSESI